MDYVLQYSYIFVRFVRVSGGLTQSIRNFAKSLEGWMKAALSQSSAAPEKENDLALPGMYNTRI